MIRCKVKLSGPPLPALATFGDQARNMLATARMLRLGQTARDVVVARVKRAVGSDDAPMPPLKNSKVARVFAGRINGVATFTDRGYPQWKAAHGLQPIRDLTGDGSQGGNMLENLTVRDAGATSSRVRISLTKLKQRQKALANEKLAPWFGFSEGDGRKIAAFAAIQFGEAVAVLARKTGLRIK